MAAVKSSSHIFLLLVLLITLTFISTSYADKSLLTRLCNATPDPTKCMSCMDTSPGSDTLDERGVTRVAMGCADYRLDRLRDSVARVPSPGAGLAQALQQCAITLQDVKISTMAIAQQVQNYEYTSAKEAVKDVLLPHIDSCEGNMKAKLLPVPPEIDDGTKDIDMDWSIVIGMLDELIKKKE